MLIKLEVQTRSESTGLDIHPSLAAAIKAAAEDDTIWKISFSLSNGERVRLVRRFEDDFEIDKFYLRPILDKDK